MTNILLPKEQPHVTGAYSSIEPVDMRMVSLMRLILAVSALVIIYIDPSEPDRLVPVTYVSLALYTGYSVLLYAVAVRRPERIPVRYAHWIDTAWYILFIALSSGTSSIFFFFFFFAILVASFRWGFSEGLYVCIASATLFTVVGYLAAPGGYDFELNRFLLRPIYLLVLGYMIAYWGGREVTFKRRLAFLKEVNRVSNPRFGVDQTISSIMERLRDFYGADSCLLMLSLPDSTDYFIRRAEKGRPEAALVAERVPARALRLLIAPRLDQSVIFNCTSSWRMHVPRYRTYSTNKNAPGEDPHGEGAEAAEALADILGGSYISIPLQTRNLMSGRLYLVCQNYVFNSSDADFLRQLVEQVQPVLENIQLLDNLASEAAEQERNRISRDIHDSTIQPYIGFKLALESLRRRMPMSGEVGRELDDLLGMVNEGISDLRHYILGLRAKGTSSGAVLVPAIRRQVDKFIAFYGIQIEVRADEEIRVNDRLAAEIFQLVREGLSNVRRHTEARRAVVSLCHTGTHIQVSIENDGPPASDPPSPFVPRSISERAASVGGRTSVNVRDDGHTTVSVEIPT